MKAELYLVIFLTCCVYSAVNAQSFERVGNEDMNGIPSPGFLGIYNNKLYFPSSDTTGPVESQGLWGTDGTNTGTKYIPNNSLSIPNYGGNTNIIYNGKLFFEASWDGLPMCYQLWVTDGTQAGTQLVKYVSLPMYSYSPAFTICNGKLYFVAMDSLQTFNALWVSDGTANGTQIVKNFGSYYFPLFSTIPITVYNNKIFFTMGDSTQTHTALWTSDGTEKGTQMLENWLSILYEPTDITVYKGKMFFSHIDTSVNSGLWISDGTVNGTKSFKTTIEAPNNFTIYNDKLYFTAMGLWTSDGTVTGTQLVKSGIDFNGHISFNNKLFFTGNDSVHGNEPWVSDGTSSGTQMLKDIYPGITGSGPSGYTIYNNKLYFTANDSEFGNQLFVTDGTALGTQLIKPIFASKNALRSSYLAVYNGSLYFSARYYPSFNNNLWKFTDGSHPLSTNNSLKIYPNPANQQLTIENPVDTDLRVTFYNVVGQSLKTLTLAAPINTIDVNSYPAGLYFIKANNLKAMPIIITH